MTSLPQRLFATVAAVCATAAVTCAVPEVCAREFLAEATVLANRLTRCPAAADDLVGESALRLLAGHDDILREDDKGRRRGYVRRCLENALRDELRRRARLRPVTDLTDEAGPGFERAVTKNVATELQIEEFRAGLEPDDGEVLALLEDELTERQIAARLGRTRHSVRCSIDRLRNAATRYFGGNGTS